MPARPQRSVQAAEFAAIERGLGRVEARIIQEQEGGLVLCSEGLAVIKGSNGSLATVTLVPTPGKQAISFNTRFENLRIPLCVLGDDGKQYRYIGRSMLHLGKMVLVSDGVVVPIEIVRLRPDPAELEAFSSLKSKENANIHENTPENLGESTEGASTKISTFGLNDARYSISLFNKHLIPFYEDGHFIEDFHAGDRVWWHDGSQVKYGRVAGALTDSPLNTDLIRFVTVVHYASDYTRQGTSTSQVLPIVLRHTVNKGQERFLWDWMCSLALELKNLQLDALSLPRTGTSLFESLPVAYVEGLNLRATRPLAVDPPSCHDFALYRSARDMAPMVECEFYQGKLTVHSFKKRTFVLQEAGSAKKVAKHLVKEYAKNVENPGSAQASFKLGQQGDEWGEEDGDRHELTEEERIHAQRQIVANRLSDPSHERTPPNWRPQPGERSGDWVGFGDHWVYDGRDWKTLNEASGGHGQHGNSAPRQRSAVTRDMGERLGNFVRRSSTVYAQRWNNYDTKNTDYELTINRQRLTLHQAKAVLTLIQDLLEENAHPEKLVVED